MVFVITFNLINRTQDFIRGLEAKQSFAGRKELAETRFLRDHWTTCR
jgi:hypothetical protein